MPRMTSKRRPLAIEAAAGILVSFAGRGGNPLQRLNSQRDATLLFTRGFREPFMNNPAESGVRMAKVRQKSSATFRRVHQAEVFCRIRGDISTRSKQGWPAFESIQKGLPLAYVYPASASVKFFSINFAFRPEQLGGGIGPLIGLALGAH